jgi:hypothetical protein
MATVAVFLALGGGAYAVTSLPPNSVGPKQIKKNAVRSAKVKNFSLLARDFKPDQLPAGPRGPQGDPGTVDTSNFYSKSESDARFQAPLTGGGCGAGQAMRSVTQGGTATCVTLISGIERVSSSTAFDATAAKGHDVSCPAGKVPIGGGWNTSLAVSAAEGSESFPTDTGWHAGAENTAGGNWVLHVFAICATPG